MEFNIEDYLKLTDSDKLELLEYVINDIRLKDIDNPLKEVNFKYFIQQIINKINNGELDNPLDINIILRNSKQFYCK